MLNGSPGGTPATRHFPLVNRWQGESEVARLERVMGLVAASITEGGMHLVVPGEETDWVGDHLLVAGYFAAHHEPAEASAETGTIFRPRPWTSSRSPPRSPAGISPRRRDRPRCEREARQVES